MKKSNLTVFLPGRLEQTFSEIFSDLVTKVVWDPDENKHEHLIRNNKIDIAFEWQYGHHDHTVLNLIKKYQKNTKVILCLNWNHKLPDDYKELDYYDYIDVPFNLEKLKMIFRKLCE